MLAYKHAFASASNVVHIECDGCGGKGRVPVYQYEGTAANAMYPMYWTTCDICHGYGSRPLRKSDLQK